MCSKCSDSPSRGFNKVTEVLLFTLFVSCDIDLGQVIILTARAQVRQCEAEMSALLPCI
jgi:hypothetical protein